MEELLKQFQIEFKEFYCNSNSNSSKSNACNDNVRLSGKYICTLEIIEKFACCN
jgi:hypothetical protein